MFGMCCNALQRQASWEVLKNIFKYFCFLCCASYWKFLSTFREWPTVNFIFLHYDNWGSCLNRHNRINTGLKSACRILAKLPGESRCWRRKQHPLWPFWPCRRIGRGPVNVWQTAEFCTNSTNNNNLNLYSTFHRMQGHSILKYIQAPPPKIINKNKYI